MRPSDDRRLSSRCGVVCGCASAAGRLKGGASGLPGTSHPATASQQGAPASRHMQRPQRLPLTLWASVPLSVRLHRPAVGCIETCPSPDWQPLQALTHHWQPRLCPAPSHPCLPRRHSSRSPAICTGLTSGAGMWMWVSGAIGNFSHSRADSGNSPFFYFKVAEFLSPLMHGSALPGAGGGHLGYCRVALMASRAVAGGGEPQGLCSGPPPAHGPAVGRMPCPGQVWESAGGGRGRDSEAACRAVGPHAPGAASEGLRGSCLESRPVAAPLLVHCPLPA